MACYPLYFLLLGWQHSPRCGQDPRPQWCQWLPTRVQWQWEREGNNRGKVQWPWTVGWVCMWEVYQHKMFTLYLSKHYSLFRRAASVKSLTSFCTSCNVILAVSCVFHQDQKKQIKSTSQRLKNVLNLLVHSLLRAKVTKKEKQKLAREREILEHTQYQNPSKGHDRVYWQVSQFRGCQTTCNLCYIPAIFCVFLKLSSWISVHFSI